MDDKGSIVLGAMAVLALRDLVTISGKVILESVVDEETGRERHAFLMRQGFVADAALNLEPTDNHVIHGHRGVIGVQYHVSGEARHASVGAVYRTRLWRLACWRAHWIVSWKGGATHLILYTARHQ